MSPPGREPGVKNARLTTRVSVWAEQDGTGIVTDSSTGYRLPNGAMRAPDVAWVERSRLAAVRRKASASFCRCAPIL